MRHDDRGMGAGCRHLGGEHTARDRGLYRAMSPVGSDIEEFLASATLRSPGMLLGEDDRTYNLRLPRLEPIAAVTQMLAWTWSFREAG